MTDIHNTNTPDIQILTTELQTLLQSPPEANLLERQTQILDRLFTMILDDKVTTRLPTCGGYPESVQKWLIFALKIQKQCTDTAKAKAAMDYMNGLNTVHTAPRPLKIEKRTEGS